MIEAPLMGLLECGIFELKIEKGSGTAGSAEEISPEY